mgnify:CR=1 FL=1
MPNKIKRWIISVFLGLLAITVAVLLTFSDKVIEYFMPNGQLVKVESEADYMILHIDDLDDLHNEKN